MRLGGVPGERKRKGGRGGDIQWIDTSRLTLGGPSVGFCAAERIDGDGGRQSLLETSAGDGGREGKDWRRSPNLCAFIFTLPCEPVRVKQPCGAAE